MAASPFPPSINPSSSSEIVWLDNKNINLIFPIHSNMRTMILNAACSYGHEMSIKKAKELFIEYLKR